MSDLVNGDAAADQKAKVAKLTATYANLTDTEIKTHSQTNLNAIINIIEGAVKNYLKEDLHLVATIDLSVIQFLQKGLPLLFADLDKEETKQKHIDYVSLGVITEVIKGYAQAEDKRRAVNPIKPNDTEANLLKKYKEEYTKVLDLLKWTTEQEKKKPSLAIWAKVHQKVS